MKILVIGGTRFVGRHFVDAALARGHVITLFNRGQSNADLFPGVEHLHGDRDGDLAALQGKRWDAVVDTCGYVPRVVRQSAELLADAVDRYLFISTLSVYENPMERGEGEEATVQTLEDRTTENVGEAYGGLKVLCEQTVEQIYGARALIVRPGMIVGPYDPSDRYTYWDVRIARGGEVLVPGAPDDPAQNIDARDLGTFMIVALEQKAAGVFNATGQPITWGQWMATLRSASGSDAALTWVNDAFLEQRGLTAQEFPFWFPAQYRNLFTVSVQKAVDVGLTFRPALDTAHDTLAWKGTEELRAGLTPVREAELLDEWHQQAG